MWTFLPFPVETLFNDYDIFFGGGGGGGGGGGLAYPLIVESAFFDV